MTTATQVVQCNMFNVTTTVKVSEVKTDADTKVLFASPVLDGVARFATFTSLEVTSDFLVKRSAEMAHQLRYVVDTILNNEDCLKDMHCNVNMQAVLVDVPSYFANYLEKALDDMGFIMYQPVYNEVDGTIVRVV